MKREANWLLLNDSRMINLSCVREAVQLESGRLELRYGGAGDVVLLSGEDALVASMAIAAAAADDDADTPGWAEWAAARMRARAAAAAESPGDRD